VPAGRRVRVGRVADQDAEFLRHVELLGLRPGTRLRVATRDELADAFELDLGRGRRAAAKILVKAV
jgi:hypothetical protein